MRDSYIFYRSFYEAIKQFPAEVQGEIYTAINEYCLYGNETHDMGKVASAIFTLIKPQLDANMTRFENGKKGGAPKGSKNNPSGRRGKSEKNGNNQPRTNLELTGNKPNKNVNENLNLNLNQNENQNQNGDSFSFGEDWNLLLEKWKSLEGSSVKAEPVPNWLTIPPMVANDFLCRKNEYGIEKLLATVDLVRNSPYWQNRKIGLPKFLREETFLKLHDGSYEWNPDKPNTPGKPTKPPSDANERAKQRMRKHHEQLRENRNADG